MYKIMDNEKAVFAKTILSLDNYLSDSNMNECERYGIVWGCDEDCPVYQEGTCKLQEENRKMFLKNGERGNK